MRIVAGSINEPPRLEKGRSIPSTPIRNVSDRVNVHVFLEIHFRVQKPRNARWN